MNIIFKNALFILIASAIFSNTAYTEETDKHIQNINKSKGSARQLQDRNIIALQTLKNTIDKAKAVKIEKIKVAEDLFTKEEQKLLHNYDSLLQEFERALQEPTRDAQEKIKKSLKAYIKSSSVIINNLRIKINIAIKKQLSFENHLKKLVEISIISNENSRELEKPFFEPNPSRVLNKSSLKIINRFNLKVKNNKDMYIDIEEYEKVKDSSSIIAKIRKSKNKIITIKCPKISLRKGDVKIIFEKKWRTVNRCLIKYN